MFYFSLLERKRRQLELQDEKADENIALEEWMKWEELDTIVNHSQELSDLELAIALSTSESSLAFTPEFASDSTSVSTSTSDYGKSAGVESILSEPEPETEVGADDIDWKNNVKLVSRLKDITRKLRKSEQHCQELELHLKNLQQSQEKKPPNGTTLHTDKYKRRKGIKLTEEERRSVLHCLELCVKEKRISKSVSTSDPIGRTASYLGLSTRTVRDAHLNRNIEDLRGTHLRFSYIRLLASDLRQKTAELNLSGVLSLLTASSLIMASTRL